MNEGSFDFSNAVLSPPLPPHPSRAARPGTPESGYCPEQASVGVNLRECSVCDGLKPAKEFRSVVGRITTEACGECCDRRDEVTGCADPLGHAAIAGFCLRLAIKRYGKRFERQLLPRNANQEKEKSALEKDPKEYAAWLQKLPDRVAAIVAKTYAVMGDAWELEDDVAMVLIMDELNRGDDTLIPRNAKKKLARRSG